MVIIFLSSFFLREQAVEGIIYQQAKYLVGDKAALQIQNIMAYAMQYGTDIKSKEFAVVIRRTKKEDNNQNLND